MTGFLFVTTHYYPNIAGGAELSVQNLAEELLRRGKRVAVISLSTTGGPTVENVNGARVYRITVSNVYQPFSGAPSPAWRPSDTAAAA